MFTTKEVTVVTKVFTLANNKTPTERRLHNKTTYGKTKLTLPALIWILFFYDKLLSHYNFNNKIFVTSDVYSMKVSFVCPITPFSLFSKIWSR
jgi:hypothetical protein